MYKIIYDYCRYISNDDIHNISSNLQINKDYKITLLNIFYHSIIDICIYNINTYLDKYCYNRLYNNSSLLISLLDKIYTDIHIYTIFMNMHLYGRQVHYYNICIKCCNLKHFIQSIYKIKNWYKKIHVTKT